MAPATSTSLTTDVDLERGLELLAAQGHTDADTAWELLDELALKTGRSIDELCHLVVLSDISYQDLASSDPAPQRA